MQKRFLMTPPRQHLVYHLVALYCCMDTNVIGSGYKMYPYQCPTLRNCKFQWRLILIQFITLVMRSFTHHLVSNIIEYHDFYFDQSYQTAKFRLHWTLNEVCRAR